ncbi:MAG: hypothetical protein ACYDDA_15395 [Acidiferrobacteraceae bacterium]
MAATPEEDYLDDPAGAAEVSQAEKDLLARADQGRGAVRRPMAGSASPSDPELQVALLDPMGEDDPYRPPGEEGTSGSPEFLQELPGDVARDQEPTSGATPRATPTRRAPRQPDPEYDHEPQSRAGHGTPWVFVGAAVIVAAAGIAAAVLFWPQWKMHLRATATPMQAQSMRHPAPRLIFAPPPRPVVAPPTTPTPTAEPTLGVTNTAPPVPVNPGVATAPAPASTTPPLLPTTVPPGSAAAVPVPGTPAPIPAFPQAQPPTSPLLSSPTTPSDLASASGSLSLATGTAPKGVSLPAKTTGAASSVTTESPVVRALAHEVKRLWRVVAGMQKSITGLEHMMSQMALAQDHQAKTIRYQAAEIRVLQERLSRFMNKMEHHSSPVPYKKPVPKKPKGPKPLPAGVRLIGIIGHTAWIRVPGGSIVHAFPGMSIPEVGTVSAIVMNPPHVLLRDGRQIESKWPMPPR